jgi:hypothetical protein
MAAALRPALVSSWKQNTPLYGGFMAPGRNLRVVSIGFPEGVIVRAGNIILSAYIAVLMAALILGPLVILHGYRAWWLSTFYALGFIAAIGGGVGHFRTARQAKSS